jgi:hypothetical protein
VLPDSKGARRAVLAGAMLAAFAVLVAGTIYAAKPRRTYESQMSFVLAPKHHLGSAIRAGLLESFANSSAAGTYVELFANHASSAPQGVSITSRAVPDTRVITLTASGPRGSVVPGLHGVAIRALTDQSALADLWSLTPLKNPSPPVLTGISQNVLMLVTILLAVLAAAAVAVGVSQVLAPRARE